MRSFRLVLLFALITACRGDRDASPLPAERADTAPPNGLGPPGEVAERAAPAMSAEVGDGSRPLTDANDPATQPSADAHEASAPDELQASLGACEAGDGAACYRVGWTYTHPESGQGDWARALPYLTRACELSSANACAFMGLSYQHGVLAERDLGKATSHYERACELGERQVACLNGAVLLLQGKNVDPSTRKKALRWLEWSCDAGGADACYDLAVELEGAPEAATSWRRWLERGCELGHKLSCDALSERGWARPPGEPTNSERRNPSPVVAPSPTADP